MSKREHNIKIAVFLNVFFTGVEIVGGLLTNSLALLSDALHDFGDSITLIFAWFMERLSTKPADEKRTFGYHRLSLLSSFIAGFVLIAGSLFILSKAIPRLINPEHVKAEGMVLIAVFGLIINGVAFFKLREGHSQNEKVLSWHLLEDFMGWIVILVGGVIIKFWDNHIIDPIMTIGFTSFVLYGVSRSLRDSFNIFLEGVPKHVDIEKIKSSILKIRGVKRVHDLHVWSLEGESCILTAHVVVEERALKKPNLIKKSIKEVLAKNSINHSTIELEDENYCSGRECFFNKG